MAKPIFIVESPMMQTQEEFVNLQKVLENKLNDYHVLMVQMDVNDFNFKVFYDKDFTKINYNELIELIKEKLMRSSCEWCNGNNRPIDGGTSYDDLGK